MIGYYGFSVQDIAMINTVLKLNLKIDQTWKIYYRLWYL